MKPGVEKLEELRTRIARRADSPSRDEVAGQLAVVMGALIEAERFAAGSEEAAEHSDSHGRIRTMSQVREELETAAQALDRAGAHILKFYFEQR